VRDVDAPRRRYKELFTGLPAVDVAKVKEGYSLVKEIIPHLTKLWYYVRRYRPPRPPKGKVGFGVAIMVENELQREKLAADFLYCLNSRLAEVPVTPPFALVTLPQYIASRVQTAEAAKKMTAAMKCRILIYGRMRVRSINKRDTNVLELHIAVTHKEIPQTVSDVFAEEMGELFLPPKVHTPTDNDVVVFELTAQWVNFATQYFIALAAFLSGDFRYAVSVLENLDKELGSSNINLNQIAELKKRVPVDISRIRMIQAKECYGKWRKSREVALLEEMKSFMNEIEKRHPDNYELHLLNAIYFFVVEKNIKRATEAVNKCKNVKDSTWRYSKAFLEAYRGKMDDAERTYRAVFKLEGPVETNFEVEEFLDWVAHEEPSKGQLHYCLGLINYNLKGDRERAREDFKRFLESTPENKFLVQRAKAKEFINDCNGKGSANAASRFRAN